MPHTNPRYTIFQQDRLIARGSLSEIALAAKEIVERDASAMLLIFDDASGKQIDLDLRGSQQDVLARLAPEVAPSDENLPSDDASETTRGRGRPKLGVIAREVTLLPRHWDWLASQQGGASVTLRKLIDEARQKYAERDRLQQAQQAAYHFMSAIAGDKPHFEEASRALFALDSRFFDLIDNWPDDIRQHLTQLATPIFTKEAP
ncbi:MAG: DUF2239 family protein [Burkholderiales bacterium]|nr:DUF2239 family protein [Burkholderiales bacterium]